MTTELTIIVESHCPPGHVYIVSDGPTEEGGKELSRRVADGEDPVTAWCEIMVRERRLTMVLTGDEDG